MGTVSVAHDDSNSNVVLKAKKGAKNGVDKEKDSAKGGIEPKYVIGWGVVAFALLYDFFVTHAGVAPWQEGGVW
jgi:hypothetical protein